jgi:hypothetical protein
MGYLSSFFRDYQGQGILMPVPDARARSRSSRATVKSCRARPVMSKIVMSAAVRANCALAARISPSSRQGISGAHWVSPICRACARSSTTSRARSSRPGGSSRLPLVSAADAG